MARSRIVAGRFPRSWLPPWRARTPLVPVVRLAGVIGGPALRGGGITLSTLNAALERAFKARHADTVALAINSPGGSPVQSALIAGRIRGLAAEKEKKVVAFIEDVGASGGYWLALAADEIFADPRSIVGSIGVIHASFGFADAIARLGIERRLHTAGDQKSFLDPFRPQDPDDIARLVAILSDIHGDFKAEVRHRRGERLNGEDADLFEGQIWTGRRALELGLVDGLGSMHGVLKERYGDKVRTPEIKPSRSWLARRLGYGSGAIEPRFLTDAALATLEERLLWSRYGL